VRGVSGPQTVPGVSRLRWGPWSWPCCLPGSRGASRGPFPEQRRERSSEGWLGFGVFCSEWCIRRSHHHIL